MRIDIVIAEARIDHEIFELDLVLCIGGGEHRLLRRIHAAAAVDLIAKDIIPVIVHAGIDEHLFGVSLLGSPGASEAFWLSRLASEKTASLLQE